MLCELTSGRVMRICWNRWTVSHCFHTRKGSVWQCAVIPNCFYRFGVSVNFIWATSAELIDPRGARHDDGLAMLMLGWRRSTGTAGSDEKIWFLKKFDLGWYNYKRHTYNKQNKNLRWKMLLRSLFVVVSYRYVRSRNLANKVVTDLQPSIWS